MKDLYSVIFSRGGICMCVCCWALFEFSTDDVVVVGVAAPATFESTLNSDDSIGEGLPSEITFTQLALKVFLLMNPWWNK